MDIKIFILIIAGSLFYLFIAHLIIEKLVNRLWVYLGGGRGESKLTATLGTLDRLIYAFFFILDKPQFVALWFSIRIASRLIVSSKLENFDAMNKEGERINEYLIGNLASLALGLLGGLLFTLLKTKIG